MLPWQLAQGVYLESSGILLPWGTTFEQLAALGSPEVRETETCSRVSWGTQTILGGLSGDLCGFEHEGTGANASSRKLRALSLGFPAIPGGPHLAQNHLRVLHDHFVATLGPADYSYPCYFLKLPVIFWSRAPVTLAIGPKFGSHPCRLDVTIEHQADAWYADRPERPATGHPRKDARVEYVAWHEPYDHWPAKPGKHRKSV